MALFESTLQAAVKSGARGLLLIIDELGKLLEYAASHPDDGDVFILQELAEAAARSESPFLVSRRSIRHSTATPSIFHRGDGKNGRRYKDDLRTLHLRNQPSRCYVCLH